VEKSEFVLGLCTSAKSNNLPICVGIHEPSTTSKRVKNTCVWIDQHGNITQRYQKIHLFDVDIAGGPVLKESNGVEPGKEVVKPFETGVGKLGMLICFDVSACSCNYWYFDLRICTQDYLTVSSFHKCAEHTK